MKIKTLRLLTRKLLRNRRKTYILDVICNRFYFGLCTGQGLSVSVSVSVPGKKEGGRGNAFVNTPPKVIDLSWKFWKT